MTDLAAAAISIPALVVLVGGLVLYSRADHRRFKALTAEQQAQEQDAYEEWAKDRVM